MLQAKRDRRQGHASDKRNRADRDMGGGDIGGFVAQDGPATEPNLEDDENKPKGRKFGEWCCGRAFTPNEKPEAEDREPDDERAETVHQLQPNLPCGHI